MRLAGQAKGGYYPTPIKVAAEVGNMFYGNRPGRNQPDVIARILDPCCGGGDALKIITTSMKLRMPFETYGVELHEERAREASTRLDHVLPIDIFQGSIMNGAFSILYLNPPYDWDEEKKRMESSFLQQCTKYLVSHGLLVLVVPQHRIHYVARYLSSHYSDLQCARFPDPEYDDFNQVVIFGTKKTYPFANNRDEETIREWNHEDLPVLGSVRIQHLLVPAVSPGDIQFMARTIDPIRSLAEARKSGIWVNPIVNDLLWPPEQGMKRPLMPLRRGHIAMLIAAGALNNMCLDTDAGQILIKGHARKELIKISEEEETQTYREQLMTSVVMLNMNNGVIEDVGTNEAE